MTDREKLVDIVCNAMQKDYCVCHCNHPPCLPVTQIVDDLISHGVTVCQMQKPLTAEEVRAEPDHVYVEWLSGGLWPFVIAEVEDDVCYFTDDTDEKMHWYGIQWRCWANRPTEEERQAAKWEDMNHDIRRL